ncbi:ABC transporter permease [Rhodococcus olei]|uniref:ABC transporter permease n=1 Tax=Rhodococcus olei TaxID=2161675 RepID=A0ABP8PR84_9NOCA
MQRFSGVYVWAALIVLFAIWIPDRFLSLSTPKSIAGEQAIIAMVALAALLPLAAGHFDLSIGATLGFTSVLMSWLVVDHQMNVAVAALITFFAGVVIGIVNAIVVVVWKVGSFIATLAMATLLGSMVIVVSGGTQIVGLLPSGFLAIGQGVWFGVAAPVYWLAILAVVLYYILEHTPAGRLLYATGASPEAAKLSGVSTDRWIFGSFVASGAISGLAGIVYLAKIGSASLTAGAPYLLPAFAALFLGATQIRPGWPNVTGTLIAITLLATGVKGLQLTPMFSGSQWIGGVFHSVALILAVALAHRAATSRRPAVNTSEESPTTTTQNTAADERPVMRS